MPKSSTGERRRCAAALRVEKLGTLEGLGGGGPGRCLVLRMPLSLGCCKLSSMQDHSSNKPSTYLLSMPQPSHHCFHLGPGYAQGACWRVLGTQPGGSQIPRVLHIHRLLAQGFQLKVCHYCSRRANHLLKSKLSLTQGILAND